MALLYYRMIVFGFAGILSHLCIFHKGEWHLQASAIVPIHLLFYIVLSYLEFTIGCSSHAIFYASLSGLSYAVCLFASLLVSRVVFSELSQYPGPFLAKVSKFWHIWYSWDSKNYSLLDELRQTYGNFVRTGSDELTIFDPDVYLAIDSGQSNPFGKPAWYDDLRPYIGLNTQRDQLAHKERRRIWDQGFTKQGYFSIPYFCVTFLPSFQRSKDTKLKCKAASTY